MALDDAAAAPTVAHLPGPAPFVLNLLDTPTFDLNDDGTGDFSIYNYLGYFGVPVNGLGSLNRVDTADLRPYSGLYLATLIGAGEVIDGSTVGSFGFVPTGYLDDFYDTRGFVGVRFDIPGGSPHFGYLDISIDTTAQTVTVHGGAYESEANTPITTPVPEPTGLGLLAIGAAGIAGWRRKLELA